MVQIVNGPVCPSLLWSKSPWSKGNERCRHVAARSPCGDRAIGALQFPRRLLGAARQVEGGGSLTLLATALVETGSRLDEYVFEEFKGTGNWEIRLDRALSEKRMFPALNIEASGTRKEERLMPAEELALAWRLRRVLHALDPGASLELLIDKMRVTKSNEQFLREISKAPVSD